MKSMYVIALASVFVLSACKKEKQPPPPSPPPPPPVTADISRTFHYPVANTTETVNYSFQKDSVIARASIDANNKLVISFDVTYPKGHDYVRFTIDQAKIKPGYVGEYTINHSPANGIIGDAEVVYRYERDMFSFFELLPGYAAGQLKITSYDPAKKLMTGTYAVDMTSTHDPKVGLNFVETEIRVEGKYANVSLK